MIDIVARLRTKHIFGMFEIEEQRLEAADEIERLRGVAQGARVPKVRTSHHRNKEEAARLQELVAQRYAVTPSPVAGETSLQKMQIGAAWTPDQFWEYVGGLVGEFEAGQIRDMLAPKGLALTSTDGGAP